MCFICIMFPTYFQTLLLLLVRTYKIRIAFQPLMGINRIIKIILILSYHWKSNFPMNPHILTGVKLHFLAPIGALV